MQTQDINNRFDWHRPDGDRVTVHEWVRESCRELAHELNEVLPEGREKALAVTKVEEVMFWANAAVARARELDPITINPRRPRP